MSSNEKELIGNYEVTKAGVVTRREVLLMGAMAAASSSLIAGSQNQAKAADAPAAAPQGAYKAHDFKALAGTMTGLSASQITQHLKLYDGYITKSNAIHDALKT